MSAGGQIFAAFLVLAVVAWIFVTLSEGREQSDAEIADYEPQEGDDAYGDEDL